MVVCCLLVSALPAASGGAPEQRPVVHVVGTFNTRDAALFQDAMSGLTVTGGPEVLYRSSSDIDVELRRMHAAGSEPEIAVLERVNSMRSLAADDLLLRLPQELARAVRSRYRATWLDLGTYDGALYAVFHRVWPHSLVWYNRERFAARGYAVPETWEELEALMEQISTDGAAPWSVGIGSSTVAASFAAAGAGTDAGAETVTDWVEDILIRSAGPEFYDRWATHRVAFDDPAVVAAARRVARLWSDPRYTAGGPGWVVRTPPEDAIGALFTEPPAAILHRQAAWITAFVPQRVWHELSDHLGVFVLPEIEPRYGAPLVGRAEQYVMMRSSAETVELLSYLTTWDSAAVWAQAGAGVFAHRSQRFTDYRTTLDSAQARIVSAAEVFRFDASEQMPETVRQALLEAVRSGADELSIDTILGRVESVWSDR